jgi:hypothetical protein
MLNLASRKNIPKVCLFFRQSPYKEAAVVLLQNNSIDLPSFGIL